MENKTWEEKLLKLGFVFNHGKEVSLQVKRLKPFFDSILTELAEEVEKEKSINLLPDELVNISEMNRLDIWDAAVNRVEAIIRSKITNHLD